MGMLDNYGKLAIAQAITAIGDTASTNVFDKGSTDTGGNAAPSEDTWINAVVDTTAASGGAATMQAVLQDSADGSTFADFSAGPVVALANIKQGAVLLQMPVPTGMRRYFRIAWRVGTAVLTAGKFTAYISNSIQRNNMLPSGFTVV